MKSGVIIINKEEGLTSQAVVNRVKKLLGAKKAGHTGTLDPMATGVLPVLVERGVKASEYMLSSDKHYIATLLLGTATDTEDVQSWPVQIYLPEDQNECFLSVLLQPGHEEGSCHECQADLKRQFFCLCQALLLYISGYRSNSIKSPANPEQQLLRLLLPKVQRDGYWRRERI